MNQVISTEEVIPSKEVLSSLTTLKTGLKFDKSVSNFNHFIGNKYEELY